MASSGSDFSFELKLVTITVRDQDAALEFYTTKLGFRVELDVPMGSESDAGRWIKLSRPDWTSVRLVLTRGTEISKFSNIIFGSRDLASTHAALVERGVTIVKPPTTESWGSYFLISDPDGNTFCVSETD